MTIKLLIVYKLISSKSGFNELIIVMKKLKEIYRLHKTEKQ